MNFFNRDNKNQSKKDNVVARVKLEFHMIIEDMFVIKDVGTIVTGVVESGICNVGESAVVIHDGKELETEITQIVLFDGTPKPVDIARPNERVGLGLKGIVQKQLEQGEIQIGDCVVVRNGKVELGQ